MNSILSRTQDVINNIIFHANRYADGLIKTGGRKTCTELAKTMHVGHDKIQRDLDSTSEHLDEVRARLISNVIDKKKQGFLIADSTLLIKEYAHKIEGVSYQHDGSKDQIIPGIGLSAIVWTDFETTQPVDLFMWQKGDRSKIATSTDRVIALAQKTNALGVLADAAFASIEALEKYDQAKVSYVMRFHANRVVTVPGFAGAVPIKNHPAFKLTRNRRCTIRTTIWHGMKLRVIALKFKNKSGEWNHMFLVTNMSRYDAQKIAKLYKHRWKIETFFRTCKQKFGLGDCQARSIKKQEAHCLNVFLAYSKYMDNKRTSEKLSINRLDGKKPLSCLTQKSLPVRSLERYA